MDIIVRKPTDAEKKEMMTMPTWSSEIDTFDWVYDLEETSLIIKGEVEVRHKGGNVVLKEGDYVIFPKGLSCVWSVRRPIKKHYVLG